MDYRTFAGKGTSEVIEKKSRFLGEAVRVSSLGEAEDYIAAVRRRHYDARHHCFAFVVGEPGTPDEILRSGDDGEPSGTAGKPMLEILTGRDLHNVLIVVTRYFGGTLLGTGGLLRAYSAAAREAADAAGAVCVREGALIRFSCSYNQLGRFQHFFSEEGFRIAGTEYGGDVTMSVVVPAAEADRVMRQIADLTGGASEGVLAGTEMYEEL